MSYIIKPKEGSVHKKTRLGCGRGSGNGKNAGYGHKGQKKRSGQARPYIGYEGGQMPLFRRLPKRGFNHKGEVFNIVNVGVLNQFSDGEVVTLEKLIEKGFLAKKNLKLKILGDGELKKKLTVEAHKFSSTAKEKIEKAGGSIKTLEG